MPLSLPLYVFVSAYINIDIDIDINTNTSYYLADFAWTPAKKWPQTTQFFRQGGLMLLPTRLCTLGLRARRWSGLPASSPRVLTTLTSRNACIPWNPSYISWATRRRTTKLLGKEKIEEVSHRASDRRKGPPLNSGIRYPLHRSCQPT